LVKAHDKVVRPDALVVLRLPRLRRGLEPRVALQHASEAVRVHEVQRPSVAANHGLQDGCILRAKGKGARPVGAWQAHEVRDAEGRYTAVSAGGQRRVPGRGTVHVACAHKGPTEQVRSRAGQRGGLVL